MATADERFARELQQAEMGQGPHHVQGTVVQGVPVGAHPTSIGAPRIAAAPPVLVAVVPDLPPEELVALNLRYSVICFAIIDFIFTAIPAITTLASGWGDRADVYVFGQKTELHAWVLALIQLVFLVGPACGIVGAKSFNRGVVTVYLGFCLANTAYKIAFALLTWWLWFILIALIQLWITRIVCKFWSALGAIPKERIAQMKEPDYLEKAPVTMVYW